MRLISQVAKEIWVCENKTINVFKGDIKKFKMEMRVQLGIDDQKAAGGGLKGDSSVSAKSADAQKKMEEEKKLSDSKKISVSKSTSNNNIAAIPLAPTAPTRAPPTAKTASNGDDGDAWSDDEAEEPAKKAVCPPAAPPTKDGQCPNHGKVDWRLCDLCGKRHP